MRNRLEGGGWAREVTRRELGSLAERTIVDMRLGPGGMRGLHWHKQAEWAYVLKGKVRFFLVDDRRQTLVEDLAPATCGWCRPASRTRSRGIDRGHRRFVLNLIFSKTGVHRQPELVAQMIELGRRPRASA